MLKPYPTTEFGMSPMPFFIRLLRACPPGSRLTFYASEPESFVGAFGIPNPADCYKHWRDTATSLPVWHFLRMAAN